MNCIFWKKQLLFNETLEKKDLLFLANKLIEKVSDRRNAKEHYESFLRKSEIIPCQPKTFENPSIVDIKSVIEEHPKASYKLSNTIRKGEKVGSNSSLYSDTKKVKLLKKKKM